MCFLTDGYVGVFMLVPAFLIGMVCGAFILARVTIVLWKRGAAREVDTHSNTSG